MTIQHIMDGFGNRLLVRVVVVVVTTVDVVDVLLLAEVVEVVFSVELLLDEVVEIVSPVGAAGLAFSVRSRRLLAGTEVPAALPCWFPSASSLLETPRSCSRLVDVAALGVPYPETGGGFRAARFAALLL